MTPSQIAEGEKWDNDLQVVWSAKLMETLEEIIRKGQDRFTQSEEPPTPPRPQLPYGLHPLIDLQLSMNALADNQVKLAENHIRLSRQWLICYLLMFTAYLLLFLAHWLSK